MKKLMACAMIVCIGMFCSLGCTEQPAPKKVEPAAPEAVEPADPGTTPPADTAPEKSDENPAG